MTGTRLSSPLYEDGKNKGREKWIKIEGGELTNNEEIQTKNYENEIRTEQGHKQRNNPK